MYSFLLRPKWIVFHLVVLAGIAGMLSAAQWQWTKYNARNDFVARIETIQDRNKTPPVPLSELLTGSSDAQPTSAQPLSAIEYRIATASGAFLDTGQLLQINRTQEGVSGVNVLNPFQIDGGPIVIVNRGFLADGVGSAPSPPAGPLVIGGTVRTSQLRRTGELTDNVAGDQAEIRRIDLSLIAARLNLEIAPVYLDFIASDPPMAQPPIPVPPPDLSGGPPYLPYTIQWLIFSASVAVGWILAVRHSLRTRRRARDLVSAGAGTPVRPSA